MKQVFMTVLLVCLTLFIGQNAMANSAVPTISSDALVSALEKTDKPFLLDVRQPQEYEEGHIEGSTLIPLSSLLDHMDELPKDKTIVVYCRSGARSARATAILLDNGFKKVYSLDGGYISWPKK